MRRVLALLLLAVGCRAPAGAGPEPAPSAAVAVAVAPQPAPSPEPTPEPPPPVLVFVGDGWVRDANDPAAPLLRLVTVRPSGPSPDGSLPALLHVLEPVMSCYEAELHRDPELRAALRVRRRAPDEGEPDPTIEADAPQPTALAECAGSRVTEAVATVTDDPQGLYVIDLHPRRDQAPRLRLPDADDQVIEREGGSCWTRRTYPCAPHKRCRSPDWERSQCRHPADEPEVALRWAFGPAVDGKWPREGLDLVAPDGALVWRTELTDDDAARLGALVQDDALRHIDGFREHGLPGTWWQAIERDRLLVADRAGVREYDRRSGRPKFRYAVPDPEQRGLFFDDGSFTATHRKRRCSGEARHGVFVTRCGDDLLYFDGFTLAVISVAGSVYLQDQSNLDARGSRRSGGAGHPKASLRAGGYAVEVEGIVFVE